MHMTEPDITHMSGGSSKGRIYMGTPEKGSLKRAIQVAQLEGVPVYKAQKVDFADFEESLVGVEDVLITHTRTITSSKDMDSVCKEIGSSEKVIAVEAVLRLEDIFDNAFQSLVGTSMFARQVQDILSFMPISERTPSFSGFCYAVCQLVQAYDKDKRVMPLLQSSKNLINDVREMVIEDHASNTELKTVCTWSMANLMAWQFFFKMKEVRNKGGHPFSFIGGDVELAEKALNVLQYLAEAPGEMKNLIQASIPLIRQEIVAWKLKEAKERAERSDIWKKLKELQAATNLFDDDFSEASNTSALESPYVEGGKHNKVIHQILLKVMDDELLQDEGRKVWPLDTSFCHCSGKNSF